MAGKEMREIFGGSLRDLGAENENVVVLDADLSGATKSAIFGKAYPERFYNVGIAEANMVSIAAGLSTCGKIPFACTFSFLLALRALDQIRSQICYPNLNVKLIGTNGGLSGYGDGATHQSSNDLAIMNSLPNMKVLVPSDAESMDFAIKEAAKIKGPVFVRVARVPADDIQRPHKIEFGKNIVLREGSDVTIVAMGMMVKTALDAADELSRRGISPEVVEVITMKPFDKDTVIASGKKTGAVVTAEEHSRYGGLFSLVSEAFAEECPLPVLPVAIEDRFGETGSYQQILEKCGLTKEHIVDNAVKAVKMKEGA